MLWHFRDCDLDTERYELRRAGQAVLLEPKAFKVLAYLVQHHGRAVAKGDLLAAFWPGAAAASYKEYALRNCLMKIRHALDDARLSTPVIETVRGYGYRFVAPVTALSPAPHDASGAPQEPPATHSAATLPNAPSLLPEWRQLTALRCGLVPTVRVERLHPEEFQSVVQAFYTMCEDVIAPFAGYIAQYDSDELLIYFGYPVAYEDAAVRAVRAGLALCATLPQRTLALNRAPDLRLVLRLSIHTGPVAIGAAHEAPTHTPTLAGAMLSASKRLQAEAAPNTVLLSAATYALVQGYVVCEALPLPQATPGDDDLVRYRVLREGQARSRFEVATAQGLTPLVGREAEVALLRDRWAQVQEGLGQVVLLSGDPGIGKSRLVQVLKDHVADEAQTLLECRCSPYYTNSAFYPLIELCQRLLDWQAYTSPTARLEALEQFLRPLRTPMAETVPLLAELLGLPLPEERYAPLTMSPPQQRQRTLALLWSLVLAMAERQPVLCIVEDLHWVDPSTLEFFHLLVEQMPTTRCLLVLTTRPEFTPPWGVRGHVTALTVSRLRQAQVAVLAQHVAGARRLPTEVCQQIVTQADGIPLFVEELTKTVLESGLLREDQQAYKRAGPLPPFAIPATLQDSLVARLDRLALGKTVAQLGAIIGRQFAYDLLHAVAPLDEATLHQELVRLVAAELLYQQGIPPQATYTFKHALIQDAAYQSLLQSTRQQYHQRIAQVLEERFPETAETQPEVVAQHYTAASLYAEALPYWQRAGQRALDHSAYCEAVVSLERGLEALTHSPQNRTTLEQGIDFRLALRTALQASGDLGRILVCLREAESLAMALDDPRRLFQVSRFLSSYFYSRGAYDQAIAVAQRTLVLATTSGEADEQALANERLGQAYHAQGDYQQAINCFGQTVAFFDGTRRHERLGYVALPAVQSRASLAWCHAELGTFAEGKSLGDAGLRIAEAIAHPGSLMTASNGAGMLALRQGNISRALLLLERAMGICQEAGLTSYFPRRAAALGAAYTLDGRITDAVLLLTQAVEQINATETVVFQSFCRLSLGEAHLLAGHLDEAHALAEGALALTRRHQERGNEAYALRLLGAIAAQREPPTREQAETYYQHALALAGELGMRPLQAHCHHELGTLYRQTGRTTLARTALSAAIALYRTMEMTFWLPAAEAALAQVERR